MSEGITRNVVRSVSLMYRVRGAIMEVYKALGPGLLESIYEKALIYELESEGMVVETQKMVPIMYKGQMLDSELRLDLLVNDSIVIELKSVEELKPVHYKQLKTYMRLLGKKSGVLVNFNTDDIVNSTRTVTLS